MNVKKLFSIIFKLGATEYDSGVAVLQCEVCGRQIVGKPQRVIIEGAKMTTCTACAELGSDFWRPEAESFKHATKGGLASTIASVQLKRKSPMSVPEDLAVAEGFGSLVRQAREKLGLNHEVLGRKIGEKVSVIRKIENEKMVPDQKLAAKLEHTLRVKLLVPLAEPKMALPSSLPSKGVTLGEIAVLKNEKRRNPKNESNHS